MNRPNKLKKKLEIGAELAKAGKISEAIEQYSLALELKPNCTRALIALANIYEKNQQIDQAINYQEQVVKLIPKNSNAKVRLGSLMLAIGKTQEAINYYQQAIALNPKQPVEIYNQLGSAFKKLGKIKEATATYKTALNISRKKLRFSRKKRINKNQAKAKQAQILIREGKITEAIEVYQQVISVNPKNTRFYLKLAQIYYKQNSLEEATCQYEQVLLLKPNNISALNQLAAINKKTKEYQKAENYYQRLAQLKPKNSRVRLELGNALSKQEKWSEATVAYNEAIKLNPKLSEAYLALANVQICKGDALQKQEKCSEAIASYKQALDISTNIHIEKKIYSKLKSVYLKQEKLEEAELSYQKEIVSKYLINHKYKIIYCPIPKNACTLFKTIMVEHSDERQKYLDSSLNIHEYTSRHEAGITLTDLSYMHNRDYFKFVILRNPFKRLVSAYLNLIGKVVKPIKFALQLVKDVYRNLGMEPDIYKSITFSQFIYYLVQTEDEQLNPHWCPQHKFLGQFQFDYIGQFENINEVKKYINKKFDMKINENLLKYKRTKYSNYKFENKLHEKYPEELKRLIIKVGGFPKSEDFYTPELEVIVREKYAEDIKIYEREFNQVVEL